MPGASTVRYERDADGVVVLTLDDPEQSANTMHDGFFASMDDVLDRLEAEQAEVVGVVVTSAKRTFLAGADLRDIRELGREDTDRAEALAVRLRGQLRRLETIGKPVVAAIGGSALGGGLELCLACHHRVCVDDDRIQLGFPEVQLGLLPGGGGIVRSVRMVGVLEALSSWLLQGARHRPTAALERGFVDELVASEDELLPAARRWVLAQDEDFAGQPWDRKGHRLPGGSPDSPELARVLPSLPANLAKQLGGANYPAPHHILAAAVEGAQVDFDSASAIETRYFVDLATGQVARNMIQGGFFDRQAVDAGLGRTTGDAPWRPNKVAVLGAGMMGAGIAYVCAKAGLEVVLKDVDLDAAQRGKAYSERLVAKGRGDEALLQRIQPTADAADVAGADLVIEAVFEDPELKAAVLAEVTPHLADDALLASNTSSLPISRLGERLERPADFIGLHFFSPVERMPLLEVVRGARTSDASVQRALDVARLLRKSPIVVRDGRGFFTSRVIAAFLNEGMAMLAEGVPAPTIERASTAAGYPVPVLQLADEVNLGLFSSIADAAQAAGEPDFANFESSGARGVLARMLGEFDRPGKKQGRGFYEYDEAGRRSGLWAGLRDAFDQGADPTTLDLKALAERLLVAEALEAARCLESGVIGTTAEVNVGSMLGIGFPGWTGGAAQYVEGYEHPAYGTGPGALVARARDLAALHGSRFEPPASLEARAAEHEPRREAQAQSPLAQQLVEPRTA